MVRIEIDGMAVQARDGAMIIEAADEMGIAIPRFCYHKKLSVAANCRMCLVEVDKAAKPLPACSTPVTEGMKVQTKSPRALDAQRGTMEFLLINHPLDCPICDQGGECELQEVSMGYGGDHSRFTEGKRAVQDKDLGPLISSEMTRCIHCTRCVRFGEELAGVKELGATGRGEHMAIGTYVQRTVDSEMSGNVIDLCPVGALTSKPFRYTARPWEMDAVAGIAAHDCIGSHIYSHILRDKVMRVLPHENESINETWLSDRDRFSYQGLDSEDRLRVPMIKHDGRWLETDWETALKTTVDGIKQVLISSGAGQVGLLASPSATVEEFYLAQKLLRGLGSDNIDHRLRQLDFSGQSHAPLFPWLGATIEELEHVDCVLLIGSNVRKDQPIVGHRLRKATLNGAYILAVNPLDYEFRFPLAAKVITSPAGMEQCLARIVKYLIGDHPILPPAVVTLLQGVEPTAEERAIGEYLQRGHRSVILLGNQAAGHPAFATLCALASMIAELTESKLAFLSEGANAAGAWLAGAIPHRSAAGLTTTRQGMDTQTMLAAKLKAYVLLNTELERDCADSGLALAAMKQARFVTALASYLNEDIKDYAHVLLPVASYAETGGTFVNVEGRWQSFNAACHPPGEARPAWKVLRVLGNLFDVSGFEYLSFAEVRDELAQIAGLLRADNRVSWPTPKRLNAETAELVRLAEAPIYAIDGVVRRATALQKTADALTAAAYLHEATATRLGLLAGEHAAVSQNGNTVELPVVIDHRIPQHCVWIPLGTDGSVGLGANGGNISVSRMP